MKRFYTIAAILLVLGASFALYAQYTIVRFPRFTFDPAPRPERLILKSGLQVSADGAYLKQRLDSRFRAYQPQVSLRLSYIEKKPEQAALQEQILLENIHPDAVFSVAGDSAAQVLESTHGLLREVNISGLPAGENLTLSWHFPAREAYRFVAIGDTGGDRELSWGLQRANQLGADFILHLGDAYYDASEKSGIAARLNESKVPVYVANGNHDFLGPGGNAIEQFLSNIGPLNASFRLWGTCFINLDTGAYMYPPHKGERAGLLAAEIVAHQRDPEICQSYIVFTHKPILSRIKAEFPQRTHTLRGYDALPLIRQLQQLGVATIVAGHIHDDFEFEQDGFRTYVTGSGLAHKDLMRGGHYARVLVGDITADQSVSLSWELNRMPVEYHCSKKIYRELLKYQSPQAKAIHDACGMQP